MSLLQIMLIGLGVFAISGVALYNHIEGERRRNALKRHRLSQLDEPIIDVDLIASDIAPHFSQSLISTISISNRASVQSRLWNCPSCNASISFVAQSCPSCGHTFAIEKPERQWSPLAAILLSFIFPGAGHIYRGKFFRGMIWFFLIIVVSVVLIFYINFIGMILVFIMWLAMLADSVSGDLYRRG